MRRTWLASGAKRIVAPFEPPEPVSLSYVPEACQARRTSTGPYEPSVHGSLKSQHAYRASE